jgi:hypothetical protein
MFLSIIEAVWHFLFGWAGVDMLIGFAAVAVAVFETWIINSIPAPFNRLIPDLRKWAICVAVVAFTLMGAIAHGYKNGFDECKRQWDAALVKETDNGEAARSKAVDSVGPVPASRELLRSDPFNRNRGEPPVRH